MLRGVFRGGGQLAMAPFGKKKFFFDIVKKLENLVWAPFVWALVFSEHLAPFFEILIKYATGYAYVWSTGACEVLPFTIQTAH